MDSTIRIYCDGACRGNQKAENLGAWAYRLEQFDRAKEEAKAIPNTTNNKMELMAAIQALRALNVEVAAQYPIRVYADSNYVVSGVTEWHRGWELRGYSGVKNSEYWIELIHLVRQFRDIDFIWVKGHASNIGNQRVDLLCNQAMDNYGKEEKF